ncbi:MAG: PilZ domain-containing protein [Acetatifactor sp.]
MDERRRSKRSEMITALIIKRLDDNSNYEVVVSVNNVSKTGIGFQCSEQLQIGEIYECHMTIWTKEVIHTFLQIVRVGQRPGGYSYGATYVGMTDADAARIETYQIVQEYE